MSDLPSFFPYLKTREGRCSLLLVIATGLVLAFFVGLTFFEPLNRQYHLDFGKAEWIEAVTPSPDAYFRKTIYLSGPIDRAWIEIASTDNFTLFVNNNVVEYHTLDSVCVSGIYDIKRQLQPGKNVIAVQVIRDSFPGNAQLLVRGFFRIVGSPVQEFWSDPADQSWRASSTPDGIVKGYRWCHPLLDDSFWSLPRLAPANGRFANIDTVTMDPRLLEAEPLGKWIAAPPGVGSQASFVGDLRLPANRRETWLEVAATGDYDLFVNGHLVTTVEQSATSGTVKFPAAQALIVQPSLLAYDVTRWLHSGLNSLAVRIRSQTLAPAWVLADGYTVLPGGRLERFGTDASWRALLYTRESRPALVVGNYGDQPWGDLLQSTATATVSPIFDLIQIVTWSVIALTVVGALLAIWILSSIFVTLISRVPVYKLWTGDAVFMLCVLVLMLLFWLLTFDVRFDRNWCFQPRVVYGLIVLVLAGRLLLLLPRRSVTVAKAPRRANSLLDRARRHWKMVVLGCIVLLGFYLRVRNLTTQSLDVDEFGLIQFSRGVQEKGFPFIRLGSFQKDISTYELISYSIAASRQFLGETEAAFRTPSLVYATLAIVLVGIAGSRMMGWRVGLTSALMFSVLPTALYYGVNAFWPSQQLLFALGTIWCFYEATRAGPLRPGFLYAATVCFVLGYFSWEGTGFLLPTLLALMFVRRWGTYDWMADWHLWRCFVVLCFAVGIQLTYRQIESMPAYMQTGISLSDVTTPLPVWLDLTRYDPDYYFKHCLFSENIFLMTVVTIGGIWWGWRDRAIRYLFVTIVLLVMWYTEFLPAYAERYSYDYQVLLILTSVGILFKLVDWILSLSESKLRWAAVAGIITVFLIGTNGFVLQTYRLSESSSFGFYGYRMGIYRCGYRECAKFVADHFRPGDGLIVSIPHVFEYYSKLHVDYSISTMLDKKVTYSGALDTPAFLDKFRGYPCVRSLEELEDLRGRFKRIWIVSVPIEIVQPQVGQYLSQNAKVVFQTYRGEVQLLQAISDQRQLYVR
jgi:hypothetical protein